MKRLVPHLQCLLLCLLLAAPAAHAITLTSSPGGTIPDLGQFADSIDTSPFFDPTDVVSSVHLIVYIDHTWVGDLALTLTSPTGTELQIFARPGAVHPDEGTEAPYGDSSNLSSANPITFQDGGISAETLGAGLGGGADIPSAVYAADTDGWTSDITDFDGFVGELASGSWTLSAGDYATFFEGTLVRWDLVIVPEPATGLLLGLGLVGLAIAGRPRVLASRARRSSALSLRVR